ncbi:MAG: EI24 domain-containing protein [Burkholderiales bacterium]|nr:EI24 domain-containing protein [Burkholderiales bacterium]
MFEAFWRALVQLVHPRVLVRTLLPLLVMGLAIVVAAWLGWEGAVDGVRETLQRFDLSNAAMQWLDSVGANSLRAVLAPIIVVALAVPVVVMGTLLLVGWTVTPLIVQLVARRRFPALEQHRGARWWQALGWSLLCALAALLALVASLPLWLIPPLALVLPPLIWGWLTYRVFAFDVLALHASAEERRHLMHVHRWPLLAMGVCSGLLGALPALVWTLGTAALIFAPFFLVASVWLYTLVFAFAALWFAHYALDKLDRHRAALGAVTTPPLAPMAVARSPSPPAQTPEHRP